MTKSHATLFAVLAGLALILVSTEDAFAKRLGGGKSFGSRPSYSQPYRPAPDAAPNYRAPQSSYQPATQRNQALRESFRNRGGFMGMLGGLALGGLLGSMLFGGGFEHINFFDIAVLGLAAYLLYRLFVSRGRPQWEPAAAGKGQSSDASFDLGRSATPVPENPGVSARPSARFDTNVMFRGDASVRSGGAGTRAALPPGFNEGIFLERAKAAYQHLQSAWDDGDLGELRALTSPGVFAELSRQIEERHGPTKTRILSLEADLVEVLDGESSTVASVIFDAQVEENEAAGPARVREIWHFTRDKHSRQPTWFLDGIQQIDG